MPPCQPGKWAFHPLSAILYGSLELPRVPKSVLHSSELTSSPAYFLSTYPQSLAWAFIKALFFSGAGLCLTVRGDIESHRRYLLSSVDLEHSLSCTSD